jgi:hypothetical protein
MVQLQWVLFCFGAATGSRGIGGSLFSLALEVLGSAEVAQQVSCAYLAYI